MRWVALAVSIALPWVAFASPARPRPHECRPWEKVCGVCKNCSKCRYCTGGGECSVKQERKEKKQR